VPSHSTLSAQVVLRPAGEPSRLPITADTLLDHAPDPGDAAQVAEHLRAEGFEVGPLVGTSFAITASRTRFETTFGVHLEVERGPDDAVSRVTTSEGEFELPVGRLPTAVARHVSAVTFTPPPDFGPGSFA
jgi:hypothetical protein